MAGALGSGRTFANAGNAAAVIAGAGLFLSARGLSAEILCISLACWTASIVLSVRVRLDEGLFRALAEHPEAGNDLDALMLDWRLTRNSTERTVGQRCQGAMGLWRIQMATLVMQLIVLSIGCAMEIAGL